MNNNEFHAKELADNDAIPYLIVRLPNGESDVVGCHELTPDMEIYSIMEPSYND